MTTPTWMYELRNRTLGDKPILKSSNYCRGAVECPVPREKAKGKTALILWETGDERAPVGFALRCRNRNIVHGQTTVDVAIEQIETVLS